MVLVYVRSRVFGGVRGLHSVLGFGLILGLGYM